jgi:hypothetical protein
LFSTEPEISNVIVVVLGKVESDCLILRNVGVDEGVVTGTHIKPRLRNSAILANIRSIGKAADFNAPLDFT